MSVQSVGNSSLMYPFSTMTHSGMSGMETSGSFVKIASALVKAQQKMGNAVKDAKNPFFKSSYADLNSIREAVMPALAEVGIGVFQPTVVVGGKQYIRTLLLHESGEYLSADTEVVVAKQNDPQALGSAMSYARRYGLQAFLNCGTADDDGEGAMNRKNAPVVTASEPAKKTSSFRKSTTATTVPVATPVVQVPSEPSVEGWE